MREEQMTEGVRRKLAEERLYVILDMIREERKHQDAKWGVIEGRLAKTDENWLAILGEELGEACQAVVHQDVDNLIEELTQIAAVCVAHLEAIVERNKLGVMLIPNDGLARHFDLPTRMGVLYGTICRERLEKGPDDRANRSAYGVSKTGLVSDSPVSE